jgi:hypothetical protein
MKQSSFKSMVIAAIAIACMAVPAMSSAQRNGDFGQNQDRYGNQDRRGNQNNRWRNNTNRALKNLVDHAERASNEFRDDFEHQYRGRDRGRNWQRTDYGYWGSDLKSDIQRMDEAFEKLRRDVDRSDTRDGSARRSMDAVVRYARQIDREMGRGFGNYRGNDRNLSSDWRSLKGMIDDLSREFGMRSGW